MRPLRRPRPVGAITWAYLFQPSSRDQTFFVKINIHGFLCKNRFFWNNKHAGNTYFAAQEKYLTWLTTSASPFTASGAVSPFLALPHLKSAATLPAFKLTFWITPYFLDRK